MPKGLHKTFNDTLKMSTEQIVYLILIRIYKNHIEFGLFFLITQRLNFCHRWLILISQPTNHRLRQQSAKVTLPSSQIYLIKRPIV